MISPKREKISPVDTAWLRMDRPSNLMMICGVLLFDGRVDFGRLQAVVNDRWLRFGTVLPAPGAGLGVASWETSADFDIDDHVLPVALPGRAGKRELQALVSRLACPPLNPARPLWQFHLVDHYARPAARSSRASTTAMPTASRWSSVMLSMTDATRSAASARHAVRRRGRGARKGSDDALGTLLGPPFAGAMNTALKVGATLVDTGAEIWSGARPRADGAAPEPGAALTRRDSPSSR